MKNESLVKPPTIKYFNEFLAEVERLTPADKNLCLIEPWVSGGTTGSGLVVSHSEDLPIVYGFVWKLHPDYRGEIQIGDMVTFTRYSYETVAEGSGVDGKWQLAVMRVEDIEAIAQFDADELVD